MKIKEKRYGKRTNLVKIISLYYKFSAISFNREHTTSSRCENVGNLFSNISIFL